MQYEASASIAAAPEEIWAILTDATSYATWDSGIERVDGTIAPGKKIRLHTKVTPGRSWPVKVTRFSPAREMAWTGGMPLGLFRGVRTFTLTPQDDATTRFVMREVFSGPMVGVIAKKMPDLGPSFQQFTEGLKARAEAPA